MEIRCFGSPRLYAGRTGTRMDRIAMPGVALLLLAASWGTPVQANVIPVNTTADIGSSGVCALRDAITATITNAQVNGCPAGAGADTIIFNVSGTIQLSSTLVISGPEALTIDGTGQKITLSGNNAVRAISAGGLALNLKYLTVANGIADYGGGLLTAGSSVTVINSTFIGNTAGCGGAIASYGDSVTIINSTFSANIAGDDGCGSASGSGGGLYGYTTSVSIINSTFSGNGGRHFAHIVSVDSSFHLANTILANGTSGEDCLLLRSSVAVSGKNIVGDGTCAVDTEHFIIGNPLLEPLADNGGSTQTFALLPGSPAIDGADNAICAAAPVSGLDQRGQNRPVDGNNDGTAVCDIGSYELAVVFPFTGFIGPVDNLPAVNTVKAGSAIPVKFSLGGNRGLNIFAAGHPASLQIACGGNAPLAVIEETVSAGASSLSYDSSANVYRYVWKTDKDWSNTCRQLSLKLTDGTEHKALFSFSR